MQAVSSIVAELSPELAQVSERPLLPPVRPYRRRPIPVRRSRSVVGQCAFCLDIFTVDLYIDHHKLCVSETSRLQWNPGHPEAELIHRPDYCNGKVKLYGSLEGFIQNNSRVLPKLHTTSVHEQYRRQHIGDNWEPNGFGRYPYNQALLRAMPVLGGPDDNFGGNPDRYKPISPKMEVEFPVKRV